MIYSSETLTNLMIFLKLSTAMMGLDIDTVKAFTDAMEPIFYESMFHDSFLYKK